MLFYGWGSNLKAEVGSPKSEVKRDKSDLILASYNDYILST